ncbi:MAG: tetratricopeptide repeat protein [Deltaproteobacteria bacterium]|nr:tetratricopeptide repeat protein [Deltaproteobacteria bacterium]
MRNAIMLATAALLVACASEQPSAPVNPPLPDPSALAQAPERAARPAAARPVAVASRGGADEIARLAQAFRSDRFREVAREAHELSLAHPDEPAIHLLLGDARAQLGHYRWAADAYQAALDLSPDARSYSRGARMRWLHGDIEGALELMEDALQSTSSSDTAAGLFAELGTMLLAAGRLDAADRAAKRAFELNPSSPAALELIARLSEAVGDWSSAERYWTRLTIAAPSAESFVGSYRSRRRLGNDNAALAMLDRAMAIRERQPLPVARQLLIEGRRPILALELAATAHRLAPTIEADHAMAMALLHNGRSTEALIYAMRATRLGTPSKRLWVTRAAVESELGLVSQASTSLALADRLESEYRVAQKGSRHE